VTWPQQLPTKTTRQLSFRGGNNYWFDPTWFNLPKARPAEDHLGSEKSTQSFQRTAWVGPQSRDVVNRDGRAGVPSSRRTVRLALCPCGRGGHPPCSCEQGGHPPSSASAPCQPNAHRGVRHLAAIPATTFRPCGHGLRYPKGWSRPTVIPYEDPPPINRPERVRSCGIRLPVITPGLVAGLLCGPGWGHTTPMQ